MMPEPRPQAIIEKPPVLEVFPMRETKKLDQKRRAGRIKITAQIKESERKGLCGIERFPENDPRIQQLRNLLKQSQVEFLNYVQKIEQIIEMRDKEGAEILQKIQTINEKIKAFQSDTTTPPDQRKWELRKLFEEQKNLLTEQDVSIEVKTEAEALRELVGEAADIEEEKQPIVKGTHVLLKYLESANLLPEKNPELNEWKERNLMDVQKLKQLYGGQLPGELPAHLAWLLMTIDIKLEETRSKVGQPTEFPFAIKRYSTLVKHFEELVGEVADRVDQDLPGKVDQVAKLIGEKTRYQKASAGASEHRQKEAKARISAINQKIEELQGQIKELVLKHMGQLPPPDIEMMPHTKKQWGGYVSEEQARAAISTLLTQPYKDTVWYQELGEVKAMAEFYQGRLKYVDEELKLRIENKVRYYRLKFDMIKEKLEAMAEGEKEEMPAPDQAPTAQPPAQPAPTPQPKAELTSNQTPMEEFEQDPSLEMGEDEVVYVHRPSGERFIFNANAGQLLLPTPPQMLVLRERMSERLSAADLEDADKVEQAVSELIKRKNEEVRFMAEMVKICPFQLLSEIFEMPWKDFLVDSWYTSEIVAFIKQDGVRAKKKQAMKARKEIMVYMGELGYRPQDESLQVGEMIRRGIDYKFSTPTTGPDA